MLSLGLSALLAAATQTATPARPNGYAGNCPAAEHRAMDYMIGDWRVVVTADGSDFATNRVELADDGCAIRENLRMRDGNVGTSLTFFKPIGRLWHAFYHDSFSQSGHLTGVADSQGRQELSTDAIVPSNPAVTRKFRQVTMKDGFGRPRQIGYVLSDRDTSWQQIYDITFCPAGLPRGGGKPPC